jgi:hypothetical protein
MEAAALTRPAPVLGSALEAPIVENSYPSHVIVVRDGTSPGTWTGESVDYGLGASGPKQLLDTVWSMKYAALFMFNRSPWVEHDYVGPVADVRLLAPNDPIPAGAWVLELLDTSDQPGALGYHEGQAHVSKTGPSGVHSTRGIAIHPATGEEIVVMKAFVKTTREDSVPVTEVATHELAEAAVDPYVNNESELRVYKNPADGREWLGEVGDPVQSRAFDVGAPEGRPCGVPEALISDWVYPEFFGQPQTRQATCFTEDATQWQTLPGLPVVPEFTIAAGGYASTRAPGGQWEQRQGEKTPKGPNPE